MGYRMSEAVIQFLGTEDFDERIIDERVGALLANHATLQTEKEGLEEQVEQLTSTVGELEKLKPMAEAGEKYLAELRAEAERWYTMLKDGKPDEAMLKVIREAGLEQARALANEYRTEAEKKFPVTCPACNAQFTEITRRSSVEVAEERKKKLQKDNYRMGKGPEPRGQKS